MKPLPTSPLPTLADEVMGAVHLLVKAAPNGPSLRAIARHLGSPEQSIRVAARALNVEGSAVLMRRLDSREYFLVPSNMVTRQRVPPGLRCCVHCGKAFEISKWHCPALRGRRLAYSPRKTCSQKCAGLVAVRDGKRFITGEQKDQCASLRLEHNLSAPEIARRVGITNHSAYRILNGYPAWRPTKRKPVRGTEWTAEQDTLLRQLYPDADQQTIRLALPGHTWAAIAHRGSFLKVRRRRAEARQHKRSVHPLVAQLLSAREQRGISRTRLSHACGIHHNQILGWELGKRNPELWRVCQWAAALGFTLELRETT